MKPKQKKLIVLVGGGSGGPVAPLLALAATMRERDPDTRFIFIGTKQGVERAMVDKARIPFVGIVSAKLRRYWSFANLVVPFKVFIGFVQAYRILKALQVECVVGAGGFVQVPVAYAAWVLSIPVFIHQQDVLPGLANKLSAPVARRITVTFPESASGFPQGWMLRHLHEEDKVVWTGNPVRELDVPSRRKAHEHFKLDEAYPTVLVLGGGTGALSLNKLVVANIEGLTHFFNVIHITGKGKKIETGHSKRYKPYEFMHDIENAYGAADLVVSRAGLSTITELAALKKPAILVAMPHTHQEMNALYLGEKQAVLTLDQTLLTPDNFAAFLRSSLFDRDLMQDLGKRLHGVFPRNANKHVAEVIEKAIKN